MEKCELVELSRDILYSELYEDKNAFHLLVHILLERDIRTNTLEVSYMKLEEIGLNRKELKNALSKLRKLGAIEVYSTKHKERILISVKKNDEYYKIGDSVFELGDEFILPLADSARAEKGYSKFRKKVLERDNYTCQLCGSKNNLEVHHIKPYAKYPRLRVSVNNGITYCNQCHKAIHRRMSNNVGLDKNT